MMNKFKNEVCRGVSRAHGGGYEVAEEYPGPRGRLRSVQRSIPGEVMKCAEEYPGPRGEVMKCAEEYPGPRGEVMKLILQFSIL